MAEGRRGEDSPLSTTELVNWKDEEGESSGCPATTVVLKEQPLEGP